MFIFYLVNFQVFVTQFLFFFLLYKANQKKTLITWYCLIIYIYKEVFQRIRQESRDNKLDFPGGSVVKNPPANAGDMGLNPGLGRSHMLWSN